MPAADASWLKEHVRDIPDFPKPGIVFKDITPLLADPKAFAVTVDALAEPFAGERVDKVVGRDPMTTEPARAQEQYARVWAAAESQAYYNALKSRFNVEISATKAGADAANSAAPAASR